MLVDAPCDCSLLLLTHSLDHPLIFPPIPLFLAASGAGHGGVVNLLGSMIPKADGSAGSSASASASASPASASAHHEEPKVRLLDDKRFMHMSIMLKKLPALDAVIKAIRVLDSHQTIDQVRVGVRVCVRACD